jgi:hypothetical protein
MIHRAALEASRRAAQCEPAHIEDVWARYGHIKGAINLSIGGARWQVPTFLFPELAKAIGLTQDLPACSIPAAALCPSEVCSGVRVGAHDRGVEPLWRGNGEAGAS